MKEILNKNKNSIIKKSFNENGNIVFSHDIDRLYSGFFETLGYVIRTKKVSKIFPVIKLAFQKLFFGKDIFYEVVYDVLKIEKDNNIIAHYFFMTSNGKHDSDYKIDSSQVKRLLEDVKNQNHCVGVHPGYYTYNDLQNFTNQKTALAKAIGHDIDTSRQHFLKFDVKTTVPILKKNSIKNDYSLGFVEQSGFRNSFCAPFYLFDFENSDTTDIVEVPLYFLDATVVIYSPGLNKNESMDMLLMNLEKVSKEFYVNVSVLFHNTVFTGYKYPEFKDLYLKMSEWCTKNKFGKTARFN